MGTPPPSTTPSLRQITISLARAALLVLLAVIYSGLFIQREGAAAYLVMIGLVFLVVVLDRDRRLNIAPVAPYLAWIAFYVLWGTLVSPAPAEVRGNAFRMVFHTFLIVGTLVVVLRDRIDLLHLARLVQVVLVVSFLIAVRQLADPGFVVAITGEAAVDPNRAAALWQDANFAAIAFFLGLLLCGLDRAPLAWLARAAAVGGMILTFSRTGVILLLVAAVVYLLYRLRQMRFGIGHAAVVVNVLALVVVAALARSIVAGPPQLAVDLTAAGIPLNERIFDLTEEQTRESGGMTRRDLATMAGESAFEGPWQGAGIYEYQDPQRFVTTSPMRESRVGAHNLYLTVWGETGLPGLLVFLAVLGLGIGRMLKADLSPGDRLIGLLMWLSYLMTGLVLHHQFVSPVSIFQAGLLYAIPYLARQGRVAQPRTSTGPQWAPAIGVTGREG